MSRRTAIVEEFDDDVDLPLPARPLPNTGTRGAILEEIRDDGEPVSDEEDDDDDDEAPPLLAPTPAAGPASPHSQGPPSVTDITPYKKWTCIYPIYIDAKQPYGTGTRRISRAKSIWFPLSKDIAEASNRLGLGTLHEVNKSHPRDWENPGRVRVQWKKEGRLVNPSIKTKKQLLETISFQIQRLKPDSAPKAPYTYPTPPAPPHPPKPAKSKSAPSKASAKGKSSGASGAKPPVQSGRPLPVPPEPLVPPLASRVSAYSPALPSGVLIDTVKAGMNAQEGAGPAVGGPGMGGKGKRKVVRVRQ
ncbi:signal recognition particle, SRP19 subunit [Dentipellis sp. KUC8613]|nr:signal recognition particle, SRP19 subunit [Dentipellis sp. KUC8613]